MEEFLEELTALVGRHSQFVAFPILIFVKRERSGSPNEASGGHTNDQFFLDHNPHEKYSKAGREINNPFGNNLRQRRRLA
jgi:hypothetical protein